MLPAVTAEIVKTLIDRACPSIAYRLQREVLGLPSSDPRLEDLRSEILADEAVRKLSAEQAADGWIGRTFHGDGGHEAAIRLLCEKGVEADSPTLARALDAIDVDPRRMRLGIGQAGDELDGTGHGGTQTIRATVFAYAGAEDRQGVAQEVARAVERVRDVAAVGSLDDVVETRRGKLVYRRGRSMPSIYHLRLLAWTHGWRTPEATRAVARGIQRLVELSPLPYALVLHRSRLVAPAAFCMDDFNANLDALDSVGWVCWFHRAELLARMGVVQLVPALCDQMATLQAKLGEADGLFADPLNNRYFTHWGSYTGLALEHDWRSPVRRINDLTFRSLLILSYAERPLS